MSAKSRPRITTREHQCGQLARKFLLHFLLPLVVLAAAGWLAYSYMQSNPRAKRKPAVISAPLVEVVRLEKSQHRVVIEAMGVVKPAREIRLRPRVNGQVIRVSPAFVPGGYFQAGDVLLELDPTDFKLRIREAEATLRMQQSALALEQGQQAIARKEFELLGQKIDEQEHALVLRKPQLAAAQAELERTRSALQQARLDLQRSQIRAPFNARVISREVNLGVQVTSASNLAVLSGSDEYWLELSVPVSQLKWIQIPAAPGQKGSRVQIYDENAWGPGQSRSGHVISLAADLETEGRLARLLVAVEDPLSLKAENSALPKMILGSFLRAEIEGQALPDSLAISRTLLRDGNNIWLLDSNNQLEIRTLDIVYRGSDSVLVTEGLGSQEQIISSSLSAAVPGMNLRSAESTEAKTGTQ